LRFEHATRIALCGARIDADADGTALPGWRPVLLPAGTELRLGQCRAGARAYLAVGGGFKAPEVLGSASTDLASGFGGLAGRCLIEGDTLDVGRHGAVDTEGIRIERWWIDPAPELEFDASAQTVRFLPVSDSAPSPGGQLEMQW